MAWRHVPGSGGFVIHLFRILLALAAVALLAVGLPAAQACHHSGGPLSSLRGTHEIAGTYYLVRNGDPGVFAGRGEGWWLFEETNGQTGLQVGGCSDLVDGRCYFDCDRAWPAPYDRLLY